MRVRLAVFCVLLVVLAGSIGRAEDFSKPYGPKQTEREQVYSFTDKPQMKLVGKDKYAITFAVKGNCDVTVGIVDSKGLVIRHMGSGVLGKNAPFPFQKNSLKQTIYWNGKDDLGAYIKEPKKLKVKISLGLKLEFHKFLGGTSPYNVPGIPFGLAVDEKYTYVMNAGKGYRIYLRKYDHDGNYVSSLIPPPAGLAESKLAGKCFVAFEAGKKALHATALKQTVEDGGGFLALGDPGAIKGLVSVQPVVVDGKMYYTNSGSRKAGSARLFYLFTNGGTDIAGTNGLKTIKSGTHMFAHLASSPDGKYIYMVSDGHRDGRMAHSVVYRKALRQPDAIAEAFIGTHRKPGAGNGNFNAPTAISCDDAGRIYVADQLNNRIQVFSADAKYLSTIKVDRPRIVAVNRKSGVVYVVHGTRIKGRSAGCVSKFDSYKATKHSARLMMDATFMAVDSWSKKSRIWLAGEGEANFTHGGVLWNMESTQILTSKNGVTLWEDRGSKFEKLCDFNERARKSAGSNWIGPLEGSSLGNKVFCDPKRELVYLGKGKEVKHNIVFDLKTGKPLHSVSFPGSTDDIIFDKLGYMHLHFNPGFYMPGVGRMDPARSNPYTPKVKGMFPTYRFDEVPYDYGVAPKKKGGMTWRGILPVKDQRGAKYFQDGIGVNMRGDIAIESNIYYAPKMSEFGAEHWNSSINSTFGTSGSGRPTYAVFSKEVLKRQKQGEKVFFFERSPGSPITGSSVWTFDATGEFRTRCAVVMRGLINGVHMDEAGKIYLVNASPTVRDGRVFLQGKGGRYGAPESKRQSNPFTGTLMKTRGAKVRYKMASAAIKMDTPPNRPAELATRMYSNPEQGKKAAAWVDGAEWFYAGASPIKSGGCSCQKQNFYLDWYQRSFVPEAYRHSIGVVDGNGNLIMHHGRYGNFDDAEKVRKGGEPVATFTRFISATDNYVVYDDFSERFSIYKIQYHESAEAKWKD